MQCTIPLLEQLFNTSEAIHFRFPAFGSGIEAQAAAADSLHDGVRLHPNS